MATLHEQIDQNKIKYTTDDGQEYTAKAIATVNKILERVRSKIGTPLEQFKVIDYTVRNKPIEEIKGYTAVGCAVRCLDNKNYDCQAFVYDEAQTKCSFYIITHFQYQPASRTRIKLYLRDFLYGFELKPGLSTLSNTGVVFDDIKYGQSSCARLCLTNRAFVCESFELCGGTCTLGRKHFYDTPKADVKVEVQTCMHFSRTYDQDYTRVPHKKALKNSNVVVIKDIGVKKCAQICSTASNYECDVFEYCPSSSLCRVTTKHVLSTGDLAYQSTGDCDLYTRIKGRQRLVNYQSDGQTVGHSSGEMGGMAFGMILLSIVLTIVVVLVVLKLKNSNRFSDLGLNVPNFSKKKLEEELD